MMLRQEHYFSEREKDKMTDNTTGIDYVERLEALLAETVKELRNCDIPIYSGLIIIKANHRAKSRFGCCRKMNKGIGRHYFEIEISARLAEVEDQKIKEVIAHELLHTCRGCQNHGQQWKSHAQRANQKLGYNITTTTRYEYFDLSKPKMSEINKYKIVCQNCGTTTYRKRQCKLVKYPQNYRCIKCGGTLKVLNCE